ncbi:MAG: carboxypeptidase-like regulatory domain-containing protein [Gemmatimonadetes bacterium]|nr:carboxypeptidase-like regulatory domain-containing protein [Gemmatimonadota bacterium]
MSALPAAAAALTLLVAGSASAQVVTGTAADRDRERPLAGAALLLVDSAGAVVDSVRAEAGGRFRLIAPGPGEYFVHVHLDGWAGVPSDGFIVRPGQDRDFDVRVPLVGVRALQQMSSLMQDGELQRPLAELCGEELRPWEAGVLVGVVRDRRARQPVAGARVWASSATGDVLRSTVSNARGSYILCNLAAGRPVRVEAEAADGRRDGFEPEIRAGTTSWYDLFLRVPR